MAKTTSKGTTKKTDKELKPFQLGLTGRLLSSVNSTRIVTVGAGDTQTKATTIDNFKSLKNLRYTDNGIRGIRGMTKINSTALSTHPKIKHVHQFKESNQHILAQSYNSGDTQSKIYRNDTTVPNTGDFNATALHTDASGAGKGRFDNCTLGRVVYCNSAETMVWGGDKARVSNFTVYDPNGTFLYDYTEQVQNTLTDSSNVATFKRVSGIGSETKLLLHCDGSDESTTITDSSPTTAHTMTAVGNAKLDTTIKKFGTASLQLDGTGDWVTAPDDADFVLSGGTWTWEGLVYLNNLSADHGLYSQAKSSATSDYIQVYIDTNGAINLDIKETTAATGTVTLDSGGAGSVDGITVNSVAIMSGAESFDTDLSTTATNVASNITANTSSPNYTAAAVGAVITITAVTKGTATNTYAVVSSATTIATTDANMSGATSSNVISLSTPNSVISATTWTHVRVVENGNDYYIFVGGISKAHVSTASRTEAEAAYNSTVFIGAVHDGTNTTKPLNGYLDEVRLTNTALSTTDFDVPASAYTTSTADVNIRVGGILPISGFDFVVSNANTSTGSLSVYYWSSTSEWTAVTNLTDNTASGGIPLAQSGTITFDSTEDIARQKILDGVLGYWFKIEITDADAATAVSSMYVIEPFQKLRDFWDGMLRSSSSVQLYEDGVYKDNTTNVFVNGYTYEAATGGDAASYIVMDSLLATEYILCGFFERQQGLNCKLIPDHTNATASTVITVSYWNGTEWVSVGNVNDGTSSDSISFAKSGFITWNPVAENTEFKREINKEDPSFYYKLSWSQAFTSDILLYHLSGIPVQKSLGNYTFPLYAQGRTFLFGDQAGRKNFCIASALGTLNSFSGADSGDGLIFGDDTEVVAAAEIFVNINIGVTSNLLIAKAGAMYLLTGTNPEDWTITQVDNNVGCSAPYTFKASPVGLEFAPLQSQQIVMWQSSNGIMMYDASSVHIVSASISNYFDQTKSESINLSKVADSYGFWDNTNGEYEYHWLFASGSSTTLDKELVFDLRRQKWFEIDRGSGNRLQCGLDVSTSSGAHYSYGATGSGYLQRLENGTAFTGDGGSITYEFELGDLPVSSDINIESIIRYIRLIMVTKGTTSSSVTVTHYGDMNQTGKTVTLSPSKSGYDSTMPASSVAGSTWGSHVFHRLKFTISTDDETIGFEPLWVSGLYELSRLRLKD
jgi:hypothetical protein